MHLVVTPLVVVHVHPERVAGRGQRDRRHRFPHHARAVDQRMVRRVGEQREQPFRGYLDVPGDRHVSVCHRHALPAIGAHYVLREDLVLLGRRTSRPRMDKLRSGPRMDGAVHRGARTTSRTGRGRRSSDQNSPGRRLVKLARSSASRIAQRHGKMVGKRSERIDLVAFVPAASPLVEEGAIALRSSAAQAGADAGPDPAGSPRDADVRWL